MLSNAYFLAKFRFDTAENEPAKNLQNLANFPNVGPRASSAGHLRGPPGDEGVPREGAGVGPRRGILFQDARLELQQLAAVHRRELLVRPVYLFLFFVPFFGSNLKENSKR